MIRVEDRVLLRSDADEVFRYLADFTHLPEWDPGIVRVRRVDSGPVRVASRFEVVARFVGREVPMSYEVEHYDEATREAVLVGEANGIRATDRITVTLREGRTEVHWQGHFELLGARKLLEPFMRPLFQRLANKAMSGLRKKFSS